MTVILIFIGLIILVAMGLAVYFIYDSVMFIEELNNKSPMEVFMEEYRKVKQERIDFYAKGLNND